eukprot:Seg1066.1 transcript_id=Seg1066.1/GoldUCD/mRNA.D3Y31 product="G2/M phase-specific E3 ubiquitin-protein ligase" protein_id=Seg1066.1/GoldUCD/D3Y31
MDVSMPHTDDEERAKSHLLAYLEIPGKIAIGEDKEITRPEALLMFTTGQSVLTTSGLEENIFVEYSTNTEDDLPGAGTCSNNLVIPIKHTSIAEFCTKMDKAFELECVGFGEA